MRLPRRPLILLVLFPLALTGCTGSGDGDVGADDGDGDTPGFKDPFEGEEPVDALHVDMQDVRFSPKIIRVRASDTVSWTNHDAVEHTVTPDDKEHWGTEGSGDAEEDWLAEGDTWIWTFSEPGEYLYHCIPHASQRDDGAWIGMVGKVIVD